MFWNVPASTTNVPDTAPTALNPSTTTLTARFTKGMLFQRHMAWSGAVWSCQELSGSSLKPAWSCLELLGSSLEQCGRLSEACLELSGACLGTDLGLSGAVLSCLEPAWSCLDLSGAVQELPQARSGRSTRPNTKPYTQKLPKSLIN